MTRQEARLGDLAALVRPPGRRACLLAAALTAAPAAGSSADASLVERSGSMACGGAHVTARASCYAHTRFCVRETLAFSHPGVTTVLALHKRLVSRRLADGRGVEALDYRSAAWACVAGVNGGSFIALLMRETAADGCAVCEYLSVYHPRGRLIAATLRFDASGQSHADTGAAAVIRELLGVERPGGFRPVYGD